MPSIVLFLSFLGLAGQVVSPAESPFQDRVSTLELSQRLDARGNLGGVAVDRLGFIYVANFRDAVWKISPEGEVQTLTRSLYGSSGLAVDSKGDLYQANFFGNTIARITRTGEVEQFVTEGLAGPVGIAVDGEDDLYVCNCTGNTLSRVSPDGKVEAFASSPLFACPNGITFDDQGDLYVTNFNNLEVLKVSPEGSVERFTTVPGGAGVAHIAFAKGFFYVTKIISNRVMRISKAGDVTALAGTGQPGNSDGPALEATLFRPNGIAVSPAGNLLYVNTMVGEYSKPKPSQLKLRTIELTTLSGVLEASLEEGGLDTAEEVYRRYKSDPLRGKENTVAEMISLGYNLLSNRRVAESLRIFRLNAESYPGVAAAQYHLGEAYRYIGQIDQAREQYQKTLSLQQDHAAAASRLKQLEGK